MENNEENLENFTYHTNEKIKWNLYFFSLPSGGVHQPVSSLRLHWCPSRLPRPADLGPFVNLYTLSTTPHLPENLKSVLPVEL